MLSNYLILTSSTQDRMMENEKIVILKSWKGKKLFFEKIKNNILSKFFSHFYWWGIHVNNVYYSKKLLW